MNDQSKDGNHYLQDGGLINLDEQLARKESAVGDYLGAVQHQTDEHIERANRELFQSTALAKHLGQISACNIWALFYNKVSAERRRSEVF